MRSFLKGRMLWHYCTGVMTIPVKGASEGDVVFLNRMIEWDSHNHMILTWIRNTSIPSISNLMGSFDDAKSAWDMLAKRYSTTHGSLKYQLVVELHQLRQEPGQSINDYYDQLRFIWDQIDLSDPTWTCSKDAQEYASIRDEFRLYEFLMSLHKDFEPIRATPRIGDSYGSSNRPKGPTKVRNYCSVCHTIETCYRRNKSTAVVANIEPTPPMASTSVESKSSGSTINLSSTELQEIIAQAVRMAGNASLSTSYLFYRDGSTMHGNSLGFVSTSNLSSESSIELSYRLIFYYSGCIVQDPRTGQELGTGPRVGRMFPVSNLHLPPVAPVSIATATVAVSSLPSLALWHSRLGHASSSRVQQLVSRENFVIFLTLSARFFRQNSAPFWGEAALHAVHAINRIPSAVIHNQTPYERLFGSPPVYHHLRSFGSACFVLLQSHEHNKLEPRSRLYCFLGYGETQKGYRCYDPVSHRLRVSRNVVFWEHRLFVELSHFRSSLTNSSVLEIFPDEYFYASPRQVADEQIDDELPHFETGSPAPTLPEDPPQDIPPRHSTRVRSIPPHLLDYHCYTALATLHEPQTYREASTDPLWQIAMKEELDALTKNHTWDLVPLPPGQSVVGCKWIYKIKTRSDGSVERYKARLVAKGFTQEYGIDYEETFAPVARISSARALLVILIRVKQSICNLLLVSLLNQTRFVIFDALYGLKQAPRAWFAKFSSTIFRLGYTASPYDSALFLRRTDKGTILLLLYVDDMIITDFLGQFEMKDLGHLTISGLEITHSTMVFILLKPSMLRSACLKKPLSNPSLYRRLVGSLVYLTVTRPDISYAVHQVSQYLSAPRSTHYAAVLRILRYLKGDPTDRRSTTGYCFLLGSSLISWRSKKQTFVARSIKRISCLVDTTSELLWLRWLLKDLGVSTSSATPLYCDNQSAIHIAHNDVFHERTKHIEIDCHFIRYHLVHGALKLFFVSSKDQLADIFTKSLPTRRTRDLIDNLKLVSHPP
ncbi:hypothetical protein AAG906_003395 [Vitis piasezkii]